MSTDERGKIEKETSTDDSIKDLEAQPLNAPDAERVKGGAPSAGAATFSELHITKVVDKSSSL